MSEVQPVDDQQELRARYQELERRKGRLEDQVEAVEAENGRREVRLIHMENAVLEEKRFRAGLVWLAVIVIIVAAGFVYFKVSAGKEEHEIPVEVVYRTYTPRLMVTSSPSPALVIINGKTTGETPLVRPLPSVSASYTVEVRADGYDNWKKTFEAREDSGRHVHVELGPAQK